MQCLFQCVRSPSPLSGMRGSGWSSASLSSLSHGFQDSWRCDASWERGRRKDRSAEVLGDSQLNSRDLTLTAFWGMSAKSHDGVQIIGRGSLSVQRQAAICRSLTRHIREEGCEFQVSRMTRCSQKRNKNDGASGESDLWQRL